MIRVFDFQCPDGHVVEHFVDAGTEECECHCGAMGKRVIAAPRAQLEGFSGAFPGAAMAWEKRRESHMAVIAMLTIFVFHCTRFFDTEGWHLKNAEQSQILFIVMRALVWPWAMELFFLLSGIGTWYALKSRNVGAYLWERDKRLLIPLYTVGLFLLIPPQVYFEMLTNMGYRGDFWHFIPRYFGFLNPPAITAWPETLLAVSWSGHLWFLPYLFEISLLTLPILLYLKSGQGQCWIERLAGWTSARGGIDTEGRSRHGRVDVSR